MFKSSDVICYDLLNYVIDLYNHGVFSDCCFSFKRRDLSKYKVTFVIYFHDTSQYPLPHRELVIHFSSCSFSINPCRILVTDCMHHHKLYFIHGEGTLNSSDSGWKDRHVEKPPHYDWLLGKREQEREEENTDHQTEDNGSTPEAPEDNYDFEIIDDQFTKEYSLSITRDEIDSLRFAIHHYRFYLENERKTSLILDESDYAEVTELSNIDRISDKLYKLLDPSFGSTDDDVLPF